ncbi:MAG: pentapeptide repeat-containing protein [Anaerolineales bacterium]|nr:pentapeptide repeat-containing protein [Anaerolineales bacterium]
MQHETIWICQRCRQNFGYSSWEYMGQFVGRDQFRRGNWQAEEGLAWMYYTECPDCGGTVLQADKKYPLPREFQPTLLRVLLTGLMSWVLYALGALVVSLSIGQPSGVAIIPAAWWGFLGAWLILLSMLPGVLSRRRDLIKPMDMFGRLPLRVLGKLMPMTQAQKWAFLGVIIASSLLGAILYHVAPFRLADGAALSRQGWLSWLIGLGLGLVCGWLAYGAMLVINARRNVRLYRVDLSFEAKNTILQICNREINDCLFCRSPSDSRVRGTPKWRTIRGARREGKLMVMTAQGECNRGHTTAARLVVDTHSGELVDWVQWGPRYPSTEIRLRRTWTRIQQEFWLRVKLKRLDKQDLRDALLRHADLSGFNFQKANLRYADLSGAQLVKSDLRNTNLEGADLRQADLSYANLMGANLRKARLLAIRFIGSRMNKIKMSDTALAGINLSQANLSGADLSGSDLSKSNLSQALLHNTNLSVANLSQANLNEADLMGAYISGANLSEAELNNTCLVDSYAENATLILAQLREANLTNAEMEKADLSGADLSGATLISTNLRGADLDDANLAGADLSLSNLSKAKNTTPEQLALTRSLTDATMPDGKEYDPSIHKEIARLRKASGMDTQDR